MGVTVAFGGFVGVDVDETPSVGVTVTLEVGFGVEVATDVGVGEFLVNAKVNTWQARVLPCEAFGSVGAFGATG